MTPDEQRGGWVDSWARKHVKQAIVVRALLAPWILFVRLPESSWNFGDDPQGLMVTR